MLPTPHRIQIERRRALLHPSQSPFPAFHRNHLPLPQPPHALAHLPRALPHAQDLLPPLPPVRWLVGVAPPAAELGRSADIHFLVELRAPPVFDGVFDGCHGQDER